MMVRMTLVVVTGGVTTVTTVLLLLVLCLGGELSFCEVRFVDAKVGSDDADYSGGISGCGGGGGGWQPGDDDEDCFKDTITDEEMPNPTIILTHTQPTSSISHVTGNTTTVRRRRRRMERDGKRRKGKQRGRSRTAGGRATRSPPSDGSSAYVDLLRLSDFCPESFPVIRLNFVRTLINCMTSSKSFILDTSSVTGLPLTSVDTWLTFNYTEAQLESSTLDWDQYQRTSFPDYEEVFPTSGAGTRTEGDNCSTSASCENFASTGGSASQTDPEGPSTLADDDDLYVEYIDEDLISTAALATSSGSSEASLATTKHTSSTDQKLRSTNSPQKGAYVTEKKLVVDSNSSTTPKSSAVNSPNPYGKTSSSVGSPSPWWHTPNLHNDLSITSIPRNPDPSPEALNTYNVTPSRPSRVTEPLRSTTAAPTSPPPKHPSSSLTPSRPRIIVDRVSRLQPLFTKPTVLEHIPVVSAETEDGRNLVRKHQQQLRILSVGLIIGIIAAILLLVVLLVLAAYTALVLVRRFRRRPRGPSLANAETNTTLTKAPVANGPNGSGHHLVEGATPAPKATDQGEKAKPRDVVEWYV